MNKEENFALLFSSVSGSIALVDFKNILDIVLICLSIVQILVIIILKVVRYYKNDGKISSDEMEDLKKDGKTLVDNVNTLKENLEQKEGEETCQK